MVKCGQRTRFLRSHGCRAVPHFGFALSGFLGKAAAAHLSAGDRAPAAPSWLRADSADEDTGMAPRRSVPVEPRRRCGSAFQKAVGAAAEGPWALPPEGSACLLRVGGNEVSAAWAACVFSVT